MYFLGLSNSSFQNLVKHYTNLSATGNHLNVFTDSFQYAAGAVWNKLPVNVREAENTPVFKSVYIKCLFNRT